MKCTACKEELRGIGKGTSAKGVYDAFWGHSRNSTCKERIEMSKEDAERVNRDARAAKFDAEMTKFKGMAWFNATNAAIETTKELNNKASWGEKTANFIDARDWLYKEHMEFFVKHIIEERDD